MGQLAFWKNDYEDKNGDRVTKRTEIESKKNAMKIRFLAIAENEQLARMIVSAFLTPLNPTLEELADVKTAVSEAVTNGIIHGYPQKGKENYIFMECRLYSNELMVIIKDKGVGIHDVKKAMEPQFTTRPEWERSGMGFAFMEAFMDELKVVSKPGQGVTIFMKKKIGMGAII